MPAFPKILLSTLLICFFNPPVIFSEVRLTELFPQPAEGWSVIETAKIYDRKNLFDYIDGGAEIYLAYDFQQLGVQTYSPKVKDSSEEKSITVEIWQMNSSADAWGVFSLDQEGESVELGQKGVYSDGLLRFWKNNFFVKILGLSGDLKKVILKLGTEIDKRIKKDGNPPKLVSQIPSDSLIPNSVRFFHKLIILKNLYFFPEQNLLNLDEKTDCMLADYSLSKDSLKLLLIQYPDTAKAIKVEESLKRAHLKARSFAGGKIFKTKENRLIGMQLLGNYLILVLEGKKRKNVLSLLNSIEISLACRVK